MSVIDDDEIDCFYTDEIVCPYCGYEFMDSFEKADSGDVQCDECCQMFHFERETSVAYSSYKPNSKP